MQGPDRRIGAQRLPRSGRDPPFHFHESACAQRPSGCADRAGTPLRPPTCQAAQLGRIRAQRPSASAQCVCFTFAINPGCAGRAGTRARPRTCQAAQLGRIGAQRRQLRAQAAPVQKKPRVRRPGREGMRPRTCQAAQLGRVCAQRRQLRAQAAQRGRLVAGIHRLQVLVLQDQEARLRARPRPARVGGRRARPRCPQAPCSEPALTPEQAAALLARPNQERRRSRAWRAVCSASQSRWPGALRIGDGAWRGAARAGRSRRARAPRGPPGASAGDWRGRPAPT